MAGDKRVSHDDLMAAQAAIGRARDAELAAGNEAVGAFLNDLTLMVFKVAIQSDIDSVLVQQAVVRRG